MLSPTSAGSDSPGFFPWLESARRRTKPRIRGPVPVFYALYLLKPGCQWRISRRTSRTGAPATSISGNGVSGPARRKSPFWSRQKIGWRGPSRQCPERAPSSIWTPRASRTPTLPVKGLSRGQEGVRDQAPRPGGQPGVASHAIHVTTAHVTDRARALAMFEQSRAVPEPGAEGDGRRGLHREALRRTCFRTCWEPR